MGKIALTTLRVLNDRVYRYTAWRYEVSSGMEVQFFCLALMFSRRDPAEKNLVSLASAIILIINFYFLFSRIGMHLL